MGREIRRVPLDWEHPIQTEGPSKGYHKDLYDQDYDTAAQEWLDKVRAWEAGDDPDRAEYEAREGHRVYWWDWEGGPPDRENYRTRKWTLEEAVGYQFYQNTSEGSPLSPVMPDAESMIAWLVANEGFSEDGARRFMRAGSMPSFVFQVGPEGAREINQRI